MVAGVRIRGADEPRQSVCPGSTSRELLEQSRQLKECARFAKKGVGATGLFPRARGRRRAWIIHAAGMAQYECAMRMWTTKSTVSRL